MEERLPDALGTKDNAQTFVILGWICTALSMLVGLAIILSPVAIVFGAIAIRRGRKKQGIWIIAVNVVLLLLLLAIGALTFAFGYATLM